MRPPQRNRPRIASDNIGQPCDCLECQAADVTALPIVRVPADETCATPHWLHGEPLKRWHAARDGVRSQFDALRKKLAMPAKPVDGPSERQSKAHFDAQRTALTRPDAPGDDPSEARK